MLKALLLASALVIIPVETSANLPQVAQDVPCLTVTDTLHYMHNPPRPDPTSRLYRKISGAQARAFAIYLNFPGDTSTISNAYIFVSDNPMISPNITFADANECMLNLQGGLASGFGDELPDGAAVAFGHFPLPHIEQFLMMLPEEIGI